MKSFYSIILTGLVLLAISGCAALGIGAAGGAAAGGVESARAEDRNANYGPGTYTATILSNVLYLPAKVIFAGAGAATSGVAYLATLGDRSVSRPIWNASVRGDYVVTPAMVAGQEPVDFIGRRAS